MSLKAVNKEKQMRYEAEMIQPLKSFLIDALYLDAVEEEFSAGYGIADIVGIRCNYQKLKYRFDYGLKNPVSNIRELSLLKAFQKNSSLTADVLSKKTGLSVSYIKKVLLKSLVEKGYLEKHGNEYTLIADISSFTELVVSVEAKLTKWRDALAQAKRYQHFSNIVFVALPQQTVKKIERELFKKNNIGVLSVGSGSINIELKPQLMKPKTLVMHLYCNEFFLEKQNVFEKCR